MPCLQEYGNIGYHSARSQNTPLDSTNVQLEEFAKSDKKAKDMLKKGDHLKPVVPIISIELPDWGTRRSNLSDFISFLFDLVLTFAHFAFSFFKFLFGFNYH